MNRSGWPSPRCDGQPGGGEGGEQPVGRADDVGALRSRATRTLTHRVEGAERDLEHARARVAALSPAATLERGYAVVQRADGALVRDPGEVGDDERLQVRVAGGRLPVRVDRRGTGEDGAP